MQYFAISRAWVRLDGLGTQLYLLHYTLFRTFAAISSTI